MSSAAPVRDESSLSSRDHERFTRLLLECCGMQFSETRRAELTMGIREAFTASTCASLDDYYDLLCDPQSGAAEMDRLINAVTVGETHFFRNRPQFDALYQHVLPEIIERRRSSRTLRIWSAGCASGEEPYSVAMLLSQLLPDLEDWRITILGTDINNDALTRARRAVYGEWAFREERARLWRPRFFEQEGKSYRLNAEIRRMVKFARLNLVEDSYPAAKTHTEQLDLILCRNVTIYFSEAVTQEVINRLYEALVDGGWLIVGHAEPSLSIYRRYEPHNFPDTVIYRRGIPVNDAKQGRSDSASAGSGPSDVTAEAATSEAPVDPLEQARRSLEIGHAEEAHDLLLPLAHMQPEDAAMCMLMGQIYANLGRWEDAEHWCHRAVVLDRLSADAYYTLALVFQHQGRLDEAIDAMKKVVYLNRNSILGHFGLANLYGDKRQWGQAQKSLTNAYRLLNARRDDEVIPGSGGVTVKSLRQTILRQQQRWLTNS
ncbi:MAG: tetratricopeptide repeat protein [Anaerolineae bacterium]|nr:tetratricopeptide repeat protein [Anaerolineae bacterium]